jgi:tetratricopeptide (TPR) repeat protein
MPTFDNRFELGIELRDKGELTACTQVFLDILNDYPNNKNISAIYVMLAGVYSDLNEYESALINFKKAVELNPNSELASLGLYITLATLDRDEQAIHELISFLKNNPADLYKTTLEELLEGLKDGYMTNYETDIIKLAELNGIHSRIE